MRFFQVLNEELGCASYLLACGGEAVVVDPRLDVDVYLELAERVGAEIVHVVDTHDHADHVSGRGRLARRTGADARRAREGETVRAGAVRLDAIATPGHRPEHVAFVVTDEKRGDEPWCVLSGDSLLVGDVARPDLAVEPGEGARALHASLQAILGLGDHVEVWPAHVGGSLCGGAGLSAKTSSTVGFERRSASPVSLPLDAFVEAVTAAAPPKPPNLERVVAHNTGALADEPPEPETLDGEGLRRVLDARHRFAREGKPRGTTVVDVRPAADFDAAHLAGALNLPPGPGRVTRMGWAATPDEPLVVVGEDTDDALAFAHALHAIGLWAVTGIAAADPDGWRAAGLPVESASAWSVDDLAEALRDGGVALVDVRERGEWDEGHVAGSVGLPLHALADGREPVDGLDEDTPIAVACAAGPRAAFAASILRRAGHRDVVRVDGGGVPDLADRGLDLAGVA